MSDDATLDDFTENNVTEEADKKRVAKPTEWGKIPSDWEEKTISEVTELVTDGSHNPPERVENGIQILSGQNIQNGYIDFDKDPSYISRSDFEQMDNNHSLRRGDLLMTIVGSIGRSVVIDSRTDFALQRSIALLRTNDEVSTSFLKFITDSSGFHRQANSRSRATAQGGLYLEALNKLKIPAPSLSEQRKIASVLYTVDQAIQKTETIIHHLKRIRRGMAQDLVYGKSMGHELEDSGSRLGRLPTHWSVHPLSDIVEVVGGSTPSTDEPAYWNGSIPWATPTDLTELNGVEIEETNDMITEEGLAAASTHLLPPGSVLMTSRASIGKCAINSVEMATNQGFQSLVPSESVDAQYLYYLMRQEASYLESLGSGSTFLEVSKRTVERITVPVPPIEEQQQIGTTLRTIDNRIVHEHNYQNQLQRLKRGLMQDLLSGEVRTHDKDIEVLEEVLQHG